MAKGPLRRPAGLPLAKRLAPRTRAILFVPAWLLFGLFFTFVIGVFLLLFVPSILLGYALGLAATWAVVGFPETGRARAEARRVVAMVPRDTLPLFFPLLALVLSALFFFLFGVLLERLALGDLNFYLSLVLGVGVGATTAYLLVGFPRPKKRAAEYVPPDVRDNFRRNRPWFTFPAALVFGAVLFFLAGLAASAAGLSSEAQFFLALPVGLVLGVALAVAIFGVPPVFRAARANMPRIPPEVRPHLFFPVTVLLGFLFFHAIGLVADRFAPISDAGLVASLVVGLAAAGAVAYLLVGFPRAAPGSEDAGARRLSGLLFLAFVLVVGPVLAYLVGLLLESVALADVARLLAALFAGYALAVLLALLALGRPSLSALLGASGTGRPARTRAFVAIPVFLVLAIVLTTLVGLLVEGFYLPLLVGVSAALLVALYVGGIPDAIRNRRGETVLPLIPERWKAPTYVLVTALTAYACGVLAGTVGRTFLWGAGFGVLLGLAVSFVAVEEAMIRDSLSARRGEKRRIERARREAGGRGP
ncbi:MAG: hypothetical protein ACT4PT_00530 [Methanobacteriota archaeon]